MATYNIETDRIVISELDLRLLVAVAAGRNVAYSLAKVVEEDAGGNLKVYTANAYKALSRLAANGMVKAIDAPHPKDARQKTLYALTAYGREVVAAKLASYQRIAGLAADRDIA